MIELLASPEKNQWNQYIAENRAANHSHLFDWGESISATYSLPIFRLAAIDTSTNRIIGTLPLVLFAPPRQAKRLISLPYTDAAGLVTDDLESGSLLLSAALELADKLGADHLELRQGGVSQAIFRQQQTIGSWSHTAYTFKTGLLRSFPSSVDMLWADLSAKVRNQVRKARRCGCVTKVGGGELLADFYTVFSENMRDLGSPVHAFELFQNLMCSEPLTTSIIVVFLDCKPAAASFVLQHNNTLYNPWASSLRSYRPYCPNMLLYWFMLKYGINNNCKWFDFGRSSPDASTCRFKLQWGAKMVPLGWHVYSRKSHHWDPNNESLEYDYWKKRDLEYTRSEGPAIRRWISL